MGTVSRRGGVNEINLFLEAVYNRLAPEQVYEGLFQHDWKKSRDRWRGKCPWHQSKSGTAFYVNPATLMWRCPHCEVGGTPIQYLHQVMGGKGSPRGKDFIAAAKLLAEVSGVEFPDRELTPEQQQQAQRLDARRNLLETVATYCHNLLLNEGEESAAFAYLQQRGFDRNSIERLVLGFFPSADRIAAHLLKSFGIEELEENGILYRNKDRSGYHAPLQGYITIPWADENGRPLTIYGRYHRQTPPGNLPKTTALKNPQTGDEVWLRSKRSPLYLDRALAAGASDLIVVEGVFDAALLQAKGDSRVVAWVAAHPSQEQIETMVRRRIKSVTFCLDPDGAGIKGTRAGIRQLSEAGISTYAAPALPDGLDPDEFVIANGLEAWNSHIDGRIHGLRFEAEKLIEDQGTPLTDAKLQAIVTAAREFEQAVGASCAAELDVFFWETIQEKTGVKAVRRAPATDIPVNPTSPKTTREAIESPASADNGYAALRLAITNALIYSDPLEKELALTRISSKFSVPAAFVRRVVTEISKRYDTSEDSFTLQDLINLETEGSRWAIPRFLPSVGLTLLAGFAKDGKSTLMYEMVGSLVTGRPFLGETPTRKHRVLLIQLEENKFQIRDNLDGVNILYDREVGESGRLLIKKQWAIDDLDTLERWIVEHRADVVMIDSLRMASKSIGVDENSQAFATPVYALQARLSMLKVSGYLIHHFNKSKEAHRLEKIAGNSAIIGACDNIHALLRVTKDPSDHARMLEMAGRNCSGSFAIEHIEEFPRFHWVCHGESGVSAEEKNLKTRILKVIALNQPSHPQGMSAAWLKDALGLSPNDRSLARPLRALVQEGMISTARLERDKRICLYLLPETEDHTPPPMPETKKCVESLELSQDKDLDLSQQREDIQRTTGSVSNFLGGCVESDTGSSPYIIKVPGDTTQRHAIETGGGASPIESVGGYARYRTDAKPSGKHLPAPGCAQIERDGTNYKVGDRVLWQGQTRRIERIEQQDEGVIRFHLGLNQWCSPDEVCPDDGSVADAIDMLREVVKTLDREVARAVKDTLIRLPRIGKRLAWESLSDGDREIVNILFMEVGT